MVLKGFSKNELRAQNFQNVVDDVPQHFQNVVDDVPQLEFEVSKTDEDRDLWDNHDVSQLEGQEDLVASSELPWFEEGSLEEVAPHPKLPARPISYQAMDLQKQEYLRKNQLRLQRLLALMDRRIDSSL